MLESYPWRGPLNLDLKPFSIQLQGTLLQLSLPPHFSSLFCRTLLLFKFLASFSTGSSGSPTNSVKSLLPLSSSSTLHPFSVSALSCQDAALHTLAFPLYGKTLPTAPLLPTRAFSSLGADRLRGLPPLSPLTDLSLLSALQGKKTPHCRDPCLHGSPGSSPCLVPLHSHLSAQGPSLLSHPSDTAGPHFLYRYSFPLNPQFTAISQHAKLAEDTTDCLLRQSPWHPTTNHCL